MEAAAGCQPLHSTYLKPAAPCDASLACSSEPSHVAHDRCNAATEPKNQAMPAHAIVIPDVNNKTSMRPHSAASSEGTAWAAEQLTHSGHCPARRQPASSSGHGMQASASVKVQGPPMTATASESVFSLADASALDWHPAHKSSNKPTTSLTNSGASRPHWLHLPKQQGPKPSRSQDSSQLAHHYRRGSSLDFAQGKLACTPSFPFSKQPCAVMW